MHEKISIEACDESQAQKVGAPVFEDQFQAVFNRGQELDVANYKLAFQALVAGQAVGSIIGKVKYNHLHVNSLAVDPAYQGLKIGSLLLQRIEQVAKERGVTAVTLTTKSFQAKDFYVKNGYQIIAELANVPLPNVTKYYFVKYLA